MVSLDEIETKLGEILETMQHDMLEKARAHRDSHTYDATTYEEFVETINKDVYKRQILTKMKCARRFRINWACCR